MAAFFVLLLALSSSSAASPYTLTLGTGTKPLADIEEMVFNWISLGGRSIDTALLYTGAQEAIQQAMLRLQPQNITRDDIFITSKVPGVLSYNATLSAVAQCLSQLGTSHIDLMLIHWPCNTTMPSTDCTTTPSLTSQRLQTWAALEALRRQGVVREIGVSNYDQLQVQEILSSPHTNTVPFVNQVEWHLGHHNQSMNHFLQSHGSTLQAYSALSGFAYPAVALSDPAVVAIAAEHNVSTAQVALRWSIQESVFVITSTTHKEYMLTDMAIFDFELSVDEMGILTALKAKGSVSVE